MPFEQFNNPEPMPQPEFKIPILDIPGISKMMNEHHDVAETVPLPRKRNVCKVCGRPPNCFRINKYNPHETDHFCADHAPLDVRRFRAAALYVMERGHAARRRHVVEEGSSYEEFVPYSGPLLLPPGVD